MQSKGGFTNSSPMLIVLPTDSRTSGKIQKISPSLSFSTDKTEGYARTLRIPPPLMQPLWGFSDVSL
jgi:hypothetical protein